MTFDRVLGSKTDKGLCRVRPVDTHPKARLPIQEDLNKADMVVVVAAVVLLQHLHTTPRHTET